jgi:hypothetical protein
MYMHVHKVVKKGAIFRYVKHCWSLLRRYRLWEQLM